MSGNLLKTNSFILFQKITNEFSHLEDDSLSPVRARRILLSALSLIPGIQVKEIYGENRVVLSHASAPDQTYEMHIQDSIDGLLILWNDYMKNLP